MTKEANMNIEDLTPEQMEKAKACKTPEEIIALAKEEGYELSDEQLEGLSGGEIVAFTDASVSLPENQSSGRTALSSPIAARKSV